MVRGSRPRSASEEVELGTLQIHSEIGRLRSVLVHEPGPEVDNMVPDMMEDLLFDDILFGDAARREHRTFRQLLEALDVTVYETRTLLRETLKSSKARAAVLEVVLPHVSAATGARMSDATPAALAGMLVDGVTAGPHHSDWTTDDLFEIPPLPNWCFQRDPQVVLGGSVIISSMATPARWREAFLSSIIFGFHPRFADVTRIFDPMHPDAHLPFYLGPIRPSFEGGDLLVLSKDVLVVGSSERTNRTGIQHLARHLVRLPERPKALLVVVLPHRRAYMHLDTVFTPIDRDACLVYPPVVTGGTPEAATVYEVDLGSEKLVTSPRADLLSALRALGIDLEPIPCGGSNPITQQREQWTDGANAFALAPGTITLYDRNRGTAEELSRRGYRVVDAHDVVSGRTAVDLSGGHKHCILVPSHEISRARGGPHCLTQPIVRDDIDG